MKRGRERRATNGVRVEGLWEESEVLQGEKERSGSERELRNTSKSAYLLELRQRIKVVNHSQLSDT